MFLGTKTPENTGILFPDAGAGEAPPALKAQNFPKNFFEMPAARQAPAMARRTVRQEYMRPGIGTVSHLSVANSICPMREAGRMAV